MIYCRWCKKYVRGIWHFSLYHSTAIKRRKKRRRGGKEEEGKRERVRVSLSLPKANPRRPPKKWFYRAVRRIEEEHPEVDDPYALAAWVWHYWMKPSTRRRILREE
ncbi:MAG: hypothetical protein QW186_08755 [Candidatus Bathyarchaeia archaeon]